MSERKIAFYDCSKYAEVLEHRDRDEAISCYLDDIEPEHWPETVTVTAYAPMELPSNVQAWLSPLDDMLETMDEEYGNPEGDATEPSATLREAERVFVEAVVAEYHVWMHEDISTEEVNVAEWVAQNEPQWLEPTKR